MKYAICKFDRNSGLIVDNEEYLSWNEGTLKGAKHYVEHIPGSVALFYPGDVPGLGCPVDRNISREKFEEAPAIYGVAYYQSASGYVFE